MAILLIDGVGHYGTGDLSKKWSSSYPAGFPSSAFVVSSVGSRRSTSRHLSIASSGAWISKAVPGTTLPTCVVGSAWKQTALGAGALDFCDAAGVQVTIRCNPDGSIEALRAGTVSLGTSAPGQMVGSIWHYVEAKVTIGSVSGEVHVSIDGAEECLTLTGVNTLGSATGAVSAFRFRNVGLSTGALYVTDIYLAGSDPLRGDCRVDTYRPTSDGASSQWDATTPSAHYRDVDETSSINGDTDYVYTSDAEELDLYAHSGSGLDAAAIHAVALNICIRKQGDTSLRAKPAVRIGSTAYYGDAKTPTSDWVVRQHVWTDSPATGSDWTDTEVAAMQIGLKSEEA